MKITTTSECWIKAFNGSRIRGAHREVSTTEIVNGVGRPETRSRTACKITITAFQRMSETPDMLKCPKCEAVS